MSHVSVFFFFAGIQLLSCFTCPDSIGGGGHVRIWIFVE